MLIDHCLNICRIISEQTDSREVDHTAAGLDLSFCSENLALFESTETDVNLKGNFTQITKNE